MGDHLLSLLHIQKLGHPLEEIRVRALSSIISKYNLNLVDESNLQNTKALLEKLFDWFNFDKFSEEKKVLNLLLKILQNNNARLVFSEIGINNVFEKTNKIEKKIGSKYPLIIEEIKQCIRKIENESKEQNYQHLNGIHSEGKLSTVLHLNNNKYDFPKARNCKSGGDFHAGGKSSAKVIQSEFNRANKDGVKEKNFSDEMVDNAKPKSAFKVEYFPWQHLVPNDKQVLSSVFDGLKYIDDKISILQSCQFFTETVLRDFPPEIFIQRPLIVRTLLQLVEKTHNDIKISVIKCLIKTACCLKSSLSLSLNPSLFNQKKEFYTTSVYPNDALQNGSGDSAQQKLPSRFHLNFTCHDEGLNSIHEGDINEQKLKKYQLSLPEFCFEVLMQVLPQLKKKCSQEEENYLIELINEFLKCLFLNLKSDIWHSHSGLRSKFYKIFGLIQELLKHHKKKDKIIYVIFLNIVIKLLKSLKPPSKMEIHDILPKSLHLELAFSILDCSVYLMFPHLHTELIKYVRQFPGHQEREIYQDYKDVVMILESMKSCATFLKTPGKLKTKMEKLEYVYHALPSLHFHENFDFIRCFVGSCLLKWSKSEMKSTELKLREKVLLKLLSHSNNRVKIYIYREISDYAVKLLGEKEAANPTYEFPGDKMEFLFHVDVLTEIICHGLNSELAEISQKSNNILVHLLKSKFVMSDLCWIDFLDALTPCLSLLQCFADKSTSLGRCIIKMFDPDVAKSTGLPQIELLKGNIRLLFSKNTLTRDEAISRLFWLLNKENSSNKKLPKMSVLTSLNLSGICATISPQEFSNVQQSFYDPGKICDVIDMLTSETLEPSLRKSALSQLSVMLEDVHLHSTFLEQKGLKKILGILDRSLIERDYCSYPDFLLPIIDILKNISLHNVFVCQELSSDINVFYNVLRSLFLFSSDERLRRNATELLCLLLYGDCILRVPSDKSSKRMISFPEIVASKMALPFSTLIHWKNSRHLEPSIKKTLLSRENCSQLIRMYWSTQWVGNLFDILAMVTSDLEEKACSPGIPEDMKILYDDVEELRHCCFALSVKQALHDIQNATAHEIVSMCIHKLQRYFLLYSIAKTLNGKNCNDTTSATVLSHMLWESTLERFMLSMPACIQDESLLLSVIQFIQTIIESFKSERLINWVEKLLIDVHKPLHKILKNLGNETCQFRKSGLKGRELRLSIIELAQQVINFKTGLDSNKWFLYLQLITEHLKLEKNGDEFYNVAFVDWLIRLLVDLTGKCSFSNKPECLKTLIIRIVEIIIAFHCTQDSTISFMGLNIVKNSLFVLNHILSDTQVNVEDWEEMWFQALSKVIGHVENVNYCWWLSFWFMRDPVVRAIGFELFVGFSTTSRGCELLIDQLNVPFKYMWSEGFRILFDERECCFVKEKSALMLSNLINYKTNLSSGNVTEHLRRLNFDQNVFNIIENFQFENYIEELRVDDVNNIFKGEVITTPGLLTAVSVLIQSIIFIKPFEVSEKILETGILECLTRVLGEVPESALNCENHWFCLDIMQMYISVTRLIKQCVSSSLVAQLFILHSQNSIQYLFSMINYNLFCKMSKEISRLRIELWCEILDLFSALLKDIPENETEKHSAFIALNRCMTENGVDNFISSLYIAVTSDSSSLRLAVLKFLINLFRHEMTAQKQVSINDIFERKISEEAMKLSRINGSKELLIPENPKRNFGICLADILLQFFSLSSDCQCRLFKCTVANALGSLLAVFQPAQNFCAKQDFATTLILCLKKISVKLSLESAGNIRKLSEKKRIEPLLLEVETLFQLLSNFAYNNEATQNEISNGALSVVVHKLWPWCVIKPSLQITTLKMLCTVTHNSNEGCRSMVLSSNFTVMSLKKMPGSVTLMNAVINQVTVEMDLISKANQSPVTCLCLQLLANCCNVTECRSVIAKGNIFQSFTKLHANRKKRPYGEVFIESWLKFFIAFSSHQEGQLALAKNQDLLDILINLAASSKGSHRVDALIVLRNICFHQLNKYRMLSSCPFLSLLLDTLDSSHQEELRHVTYTIWSLACNSQKDKVILRNAGFEIKLEAAKRNCILKEDAETLELISMVLGILKNK